MNTSLLLVAVIIIACVISNKLSSKLGMPVLFAFICLGMLFGSDGIFKINFDNFILAEQICSIALIFIMFYGGFGTKWSEAKPVAVKGIVLSSVGTLLTALFVGLFCIYVLKIEYLESFLIGSVISSTDAASVFSILRSKHLNLKDNTASMLEIESGSNDPFSYMLTIIILSLMNGDGATGSFLLMVFKQIVFGIIFGIAIALLTKIFLTKFKIHSSGFNAIFIVAVALIAFALPTQFGGNGYLSAYIVGIILGNINLDNMQELVHFFDGTTGLMQMVLFFLLGLLSFPSELPHIAGIALSIALFLTFIGRPIAVFIILSFFKGTINQKLFVSWSGMRGAASIVFAIMTVINPYQLTFDIFHIVFFIVLFSILLQGTLIPFFASKLSMTDDRYDVMKTFTDYVDEVPVQFIQFEIPEQHEWINKSLKEITMPPNTIVTLICKNGKKIIPRGSTLVEKSDLLVLAGFSLNSEDTIPLEEKKITKRSSWLGKTLIEMKSKKDFVILIKRNNHVVIPKGSTKIQEGDIIVLTNRGFVETTNK